MYTNRTLQEHAILLVKPRSGTHNFYPLTGQRLMEWTTSSMEAFRDGYLSDMCFGVSVNPDDPNDLCEVIKLSFGTPGSAVDSLRLFFVTLVTLS